MTVPCACVSPQTLVSEYTYIHIPMYVYNNVVASVKAEEKAVDKEYN